MEQKPDGKQSMLPAALGVLCGAGVGTGIGWLAYLGTGSIVLGIGIAGPIALIVNNLVINLLRKRRN